VQRRCAKLIVTSKETIMTPMEAAYLTLVIAGFGTFMAVLAFVSRNKPRR
jgi:hypothetical protein